MANNCFKFKYLFAEFEQIILLLESLEQQQKVCLNFMILFFNLELFKRKIKCQQIFDLEANRITIGKSEITFFLPSENGKRESSCGLFEVQVSIQASVSSYICMRYHTGRDLTIIHTKELGFAIRQWSVENVMFPTKVGHFPHRTQADSFSAIEIVEIPSCET